MSSLVKVGTCGFGGSKTDYAQQLSCVEVQHTFYQPPRLSTLERWREQVPAHFEFTLKAWQLITHQAKSPTYKRLRTALSDQERAEAGFFRPTEIVEKAWQLTLSCAKALKAKTILFQCPASFTPTAENISYIAGFFARIERSDLTLCWEPRGNWDKQLVKELCQDLQLWHVVDPFTHMTTTPDQCYFRLHGREGWRYTYGLQELAELTELVPTDKPSYVFFNNINMRQDALCFNNLIHQ